MIKKGASKQNIAIIVLSVLLLLSIVFGTTYSYFNGASQDLVSGTVTTATLTVTIYSEDESGQTTPFELHTDGNKVIPGQPLSNTKLQVRNDSPVDTYMMVLCKLNVYKENDDENGNKVIDDQFDTSAMEVLNIRPAAIGKCWRKYDYTCNDGKTKLCTLVFLGNQKAGASVADGTGDGIFIAGTGSTTSLVLEADSLVVPTSWENEMQGKTISVTFTAYVLQAQALSARYPNIKNDDTRLSGIAKAIIEEFALDKTTAPTPPVGE